MIYEQEEVENLEEEKVEDDRKRVEEARRGRGQTIEKRKIIQKKDHK